LSWHHLKKREWKEKSCLNAAEIGEPLMQLLYSGRQKSVEINQEIGCLLSEK